MANEITISSRLSCSNGGTSVANATQSFSVDQVGSNKSMIDYDVTTSYTALPVGSVATGAVYFLQVYNASEVLNNTLMVSLNAGTTQHFAIPPGLSLGPMPMAATIVAHAKYALSNDIAGVTACES